MRLPPAGSTAEIVDPRHFDVPIDEGSVHQGAALEARPLHWGDLETVCATGRGAPLVVLLDRVTDPHNVGAILRSAEVFGARAVIAPHRHSAPETGALAKTASGALERQPYLRVTNLSDAMQTLRGDGFRAARPGRGRRGDAGRGAWPMRDRGRSGSFWAPKGRACARRPARPATAWSASRCSGAFRVAQRLERGSGRALCRNGRAMIITLARPALQPDRLRPMLQ